ncbi:MAG: hypothetical protein ACREIP_18795, partial [Alphaproteobacteria bacterium]
NSLAGDGWLSFGWIGLVITMGLVGMVLGRLHRRFWANLGNPSIVMTYCTFVPLTILWFRDGGISIVKLALFALLPIFVWRGIIRLSTRSGPVRGAARFVPPRSNV